jgi:hypothetical protein
MASDIQILAVSFVNEAAASAAAAMLAKDFDPTRPIELAPLGKPFYPTPIRSLLVGRFRLDVIVAVRTAVEQAGGTIEMDLAEDSRR